MSKASSSKPKQPRDLDEQGQPIGGKAAEPPVEQVDQPAQQQVETKVEIRELTEEEKREKLNAKRFRDTSRDQIAARRREIQSKEDTAFREANPDQAQLADRVAGVDASMIERMEREARGESDEEVEGEDKVAPKASERGKSTQTKEIESEIEDAADEALERARGPFKIRVYGNEQEVSEEEVIKAGIAALQKQHAGELRLQDAATREAQLEEWEGQLRAYAENLRKKGVQDGAQKPTGESATPQPPGTGAAAKEVADLRRKAGEALLRGDDAQYAELTAQADQKLQDAIVAAIAARSATTNPQSSEQGSVPELPARERRDPWSRDDRVKINQVFNTDYADLLESDATFNRTQQLMQEALEDPANLGQSPEELARRVGDSVRTLYGKQAPRREEPAPSRTQQTLESRRRLKQQIPLTPPAGSGRAPAAAQTPKFPSNKDYVQQLRQRSGSNSSR